MILEGLVLALIVAFAMLLVFGLGPKLARYLSSRDRLRSTERRDVERPGRFRP